MRLLRGEHVHPSHAAARLQGAHPETVTKRYVAVRVFHSRKTTTDAETRWTGQHQGSTAVACRKYIGFNVKVGWVQLISQSHGACAPAGGGRVDEGEPSELASPGLIVVGVVRHHMCPYVGVLEQGVRYVEVFTGLERHWSFTLSKPRRVGGEVRVDVAATGVVCAWVCSLFARQSHLKIGESRYRSKGTFSVMSSGKQTTEHEHSPRVCN